MTSQRVQEAKRASDTVVFEWKHEKALFELESRAKITVDMITKIQALLQPIESNNWVRLYHYDSCNVGTCCIIFGLLLGILIIPICLIPIGICILAAPEQYYEYTFDKMIAFLRTIQVQNSSVFSRQGLQAEFTFSDSKILLI